MKFPMPDTSWMGDAPTQKIERLTLEQVLERIEKRQPLEFCLISEINLSGRDLSGLRFSAATLQGVVFNGCDLSRTEFSKVVLANCSFDKATFNETVIHETAFVRGSFSSTRFTACRWPEAASFIESDLTGAEFTNCDLTQARFITCRAEAIACRSCQLGGASFIDTALPR